MVKKDRAEDQMQLICKAKITLIMLKEFHKELVVRAISMATRCTKLNKKKFQVCFKPLGTNKVLKLLPVKQVFSKGILSPTIFHSAIT